MTATLSSKGQVVIPEAIRERLGLKTGAQFVVVADRDVVILTVLEPPVPSEFAALTARPRRAAKAAGSKSADVPRVSSRRLGREALEARVAAQGSEVWGDAQKCR